MNLSAIRRDTLVGRLLRAGLGVLPPGLQVPILQGRLRGKRWIIGASVHGCWLGSYEWEKRRAFERTVRPGAVVFDVGANVGFYTLLASELAGVRGQVVAIELLPRNVSYLRAHLRMNGVTNVTVLEAAVSDQLGTARFAPGPNPS